MFSRERAEELGETIGYCNIHKMSVLDSCELCEENAKEEAYRTNYECIECGETKPDDARVEVGMKCGQCAYGY